MRVLFVNDTAGRTGNPGCQLTSRTFRTLLENRGAIVDSLEWGFARRLKVRDSALWQQLRSGRWLEEPVLQHLVALEYGDDAIRRVKAADLVMFQPEGTVSDDYTALSILRFLSLPLWAALHGQIPLAVANGTFPLFSDHRVALIELLLQQADLAVMRDRISAQHWNVDCAPDSAVLWQGIPASPAPQWLLISTAAESQASIDLAIGRAGIRAAQALGLRPLILTKGWQRLIPLAQDIAALGGEIVQDTALDLADRRIAECRLHLGGRYHMALLCATKGIPSALVRSNTHKNLWLEQEMSGIKIAGRPEGLALLANEVVLADRNAILADIARLGNETRQLPHKLPISRRDRPASPALPAALKDRLRTEARNQRWREWLRSLQQ